MGLSQRFHCAAQRHLPAETPAPQPPAEPVQQTEMPLVGVFGSDGVRPGSVLVRLAHVALEPVQQTETALVAFEGSDVGRITSPGSKQTRRTAPASGYIRCNHTGRNRARRRF